MHFSQIIKDSLKHSDNYRCYINQHKKYQFLFYQYNNEVLPEQGWKIHLSATKINCVSILRIFLEVLRIIPSSFKITENIDFLEYLNVGKGGITQIGKFITIYPRNIDHFKSLCSELGFNTKDFEQEIPFISSDKHHSGAVFYRYGSSINADKQNISGLYFNYVMNLENDYCLDDRIHFYIPQWEVDPFLEIEIKEDSSIFIQNKYIKLALLNHSYKGKVYQIQDLSSLDSPIRILKESKKNIFMEEENITSTALLENEYDFLVKNNKVSNFPKVYNRFYHNGNLCIVEEYIEGVNLLKYIVDNAIRGELLNSNDFISLSLSLLKSVRTIHDLGYVHRDLKPQNFIINDAFELNLIDFESITKANSNVITRLGTKGFKSPEQYTENHAYYTDDIYSIGAILLSLATNANPSLFVSDFIDIRQPFSIFNSKIPNNIFNIINKALSQNIAQRYKSIEEIEIDLLKVNIPLKQKSIKSSALPLNISDEVNKYAHITNAIYNTLITKSEVVDNIIQWESTHNFNVGYNKQDIQLGFAGISLYLARYELYSNSNMFDNLFINKLESSFLTFYHSQNPLPGLIVGRSGLGFSSLLAYQVTKNNTFLNIAENIALCINPAIITSLDFYNGLSGIGLYFLALFEFTRKHIFLSKANQISKIIIDKLEKVNNRILYKYPKEYELFEEKYFLGFAHGIAGIGYFLILINKYINNQNNADTIRGISETLKYYSVRVLDDKSGLNWPDHILKEEGENNNDVSSLYWCNGATGIGKFFLEYYKSNKEQELLIIIDRIVNTVVYAGRWLNPTYCHGLAGNLDFLLDYYSLREGSFIIEDILQLANILIMHSIKDDNYWIFPSEEPTIITPDFLLGYSGVADIFLRLSSLNKKTLIPNPFDIDNFKTNW